MTGKSRSAGIVHFVSMMQCMMQCMMHDAIVRTMGILYTVDISLLHVQSLQSYCRHIYVDHR